MKKLAGIVIIVLIAAGFVAVRVVRARQKNEASPVGAISPLVTVAIVTEGRIARTRHALGTVIGANEVELAPRITGQVIEVPVREGARIRRGQVLVRLDARELEDAVGRAEAARAAASAASPLPRSLRRPRSRSPRATARCSRPARSPARRSSARRPWRRPRRPASPRHALPSSRPSASSTRPASAPVTRH